jgi:hypothetical protein
VELVKVEGTEVLVELADGAWGPQNVGTAEVLNFDGVRETLEAVAKDLDAVWQKVRPKEATVEFGLSLTVKSGKLTGLIVQGDGSASLKVRLKWTS